MAKAHRRSVGGVIAHQAARVPTTSVRPGLRRCLYGPRGFALPAGSSRQTVGNRRGASPLVSHRYPLLPSQAVHFHLGTGAPAMTWSTARKPAWARRETGQRKARTQGPPGSLWGCMSSHPGHGGIMAVIIAVSRRFNNLTRAL
jgi:hypothetical protein